MSDETRSILMNAEVIAIDQDRAAKPAKKVAETASTVTVVRPLEDGSMAIGLFNRGDQPAEMEVNWDSIGLGSGHAHARDLWQHRDVDAAGDHYSSSVPAHGVVVLRVH